MHTSIPRLSVLLLPFGSILILTGCGKNQPPGSSSKPVLATSPKPMAMPASMPMNAPVVRPMAEPAVLKFKDDSIKAIQAGSKTATIRKGARTFPTKLTRAVGSTGNVVMLDIVSVTPKKLDELTAADAIANGSASLSALKAELAADYKNIAGTDVVTVVTFKLSGAPGM